MYNTFRTINLRDENIWHTYSNTNNKMFILYFKKFSSKEEWVRMYIF